ncbi:uncharacterized protein CLUP02_13591 [Colletotrichum lupini]|uniref:Uncharacterized protein n=1 Tax=Colletotrichum lupini TaxID=145971 RepID=A0A9Q8T2M2_9PEZI|nr:uncharacterized protein CLUP02_13591 [Colletotrichum lupini]UQC88069.1 hypothetical protein CLUP02_13591 [Colletotrichum lupini]
MSPEKRKYDMFSEIELKLRNHQVTVTIFQGNIITHRVHLTPKLEGNILISKHASRDCTPTLLMALTVFEHHFAANGLIIDGGEHRLMLTMDPFIPKVARSDRTEEATNFERAPRKPWDVQLQLLIYCRPGFELRFGLRAKALFPIQLSIFQLHGITELAPNSSCRRGEVLPKFCPPPSPTCSGFEVITNRDSYRDIPIFCRNSMLCMSKLRLTGYTTNLNHFEAFPNRNGQVSRAALLGVSFETPTGMTQFPSGGVNQGSCYIRPSRLFIRKRQSIPGGRWEHRFPGMDLKRKGDEEFVRGLAEFGVSPARESWKFGVPFPVAFELQSIFVVLSDALYTIQVPDLFPACHPAKTGAACVLLRGKSPRYPSPEICLMGIWSPRSDVISDLRHYLASSDEYDESNDENRGPCCTSDERFGSLPGRLSPNLLSTTQDSQSHQAIPAQGVPLIFLSHIRENGQSQVQEDQIRQEETVPEQTAKTKMYRVHRRVAMQDVPSTSEAINEAPERSINVIFTHTLLETLALQYHARWATPSVAAL